MAHELASNSTGTVHFADSETRADGTVSAWHRLGQAVGHTMTADEALDAAHMKGWDVRTVPLTAQVGDLSLDVPDRHAVIRTDPSDGSTHALGVVGNKWTPFQNEDTTGLLSTLTDEGGAHIETIGALRDCRDTFVTMKLPSHMEFRSPVTGQLDVTDLYISILNNHTGQAPLRALISPVRIVCANTQRMAEGSARSSVSLRHTGNPTTRLQEVRDLLGLTFVYRDTFVEQCEQLIARELDNVVILDVIENVFGVEAATTEKQATTRKETSAKVLENYMTSPTVKPFFGTAFGAYNAVTEYLDHKMIVRGTAQLSADEQADKRAYRTLMDRELNTMKSNMMTRLLAV